MKVAVQRMQAILLGPGVFLIVESLEGPLPPGSLPGLSLPCSRHSSRSLHFILVLYSPTIYESLKCALYLLDCRDEDAISPL